MKTTASVIQSWAWISSALLVCVLLFPLLPGRFAGAVVEDESGVPLIVFAVLVVVAVSVLSSMSLWVEGLLIRVGFLCPLSLEGSPAWLRALCVRRAQEVLRVQLEDCPGSARALFDVMVSTVAERSRSAKVDELQARLALHRMVFTILGLAFIVYPLARPHPLTDTVTFALGQRLAVSAACLVVGSASLFRMRAEREALRSEVAYRFIALTGDRAG